MGAFHDDIQHSYNLSLTGIIIPYQILYVLGTMIYVYIYMCVDYIAVSYRTYNPIKNNHEMEHKCSDEMQCQVRGVIDLEALATGSGKFSS